VICIANCCANYFIERADGILLPIESLKSNLSAQEGKNVI